VLKEEQRQARASAETPIGITLLTGLDELSGCSEATHGVIRSHHRVGRTCRTWGDRSRIGTAWRSKPSWYIVATKERTVQPELERFLAKRMEAKTHEVDSSHISMLSKPRFVLDVIVEAARAVQKTEAS
jgi:hypothetical protein